MDWDILKVELDLIYLSSIRAAAIYGKPLGEILFVLHSVLLFCFLTFNGNTYYKNISKS